MILWAVLIDVAPDPVTTGVGIVAVVVLFVIGTVILLAATLALFLWYRKRTRRHKEMIRPADPHS